MSRGRIDVIVGPPGVGKSTTARALARRSDLGVHIPVDDLRDMVVSGQELPSPSWGDELQHQITLARSAAIRMAHDYAASGFRVVLDDFWDPHGLAEYQDLLALPGVGRVVLCPDESVARERNRSRGGETAGYIDDAIPFAFGLLRPHLGRLQAAGWLVLDTSAITVEEAVDRIIDATERAGRA